MGKRVIEAKDRDWLERIYKFRHDIYVGELGFRAMAADSDNGLLSDDLDEFSHNFAVVDETDAICGVLRCTVLADVADPRALIDKFHMHEFVDRFGPGTIGNTSRFMFSKQERKSTDILLLMREAMHLAEARGVAFNFGETNLNWLQYFEKMGYRRYWRPENDPVFGYHLPIVMTLADLDHLARIRCPLLRYSTRTASDGDMARWFDTRFRDFAGFSPVDRANGDFDTLLRQRGIDMDGLRAACWDDWDVDWEMVPKLSTIFDAYEGDVLCKQGDNEDGAFLLLSGRVGLVGRSPGNPEASRLVLTPGAVLVPEMELAMGGATQAAVAETPSTLLYLPAGCVAKLLKVWVA